MFNLYDEEFNIDTLLFWLTNQLEVMEYKLSVHADNEELEKFLYQMIPNINFESDTKYFKSYQRAMICRIVELHNVLNDMINQIEMSDIDNFSNDSKKYFFRCIKSFGIIPITLYAKKMLKQ